ncbi:MAG: class I SAM-dependent methyltransferase [Pseudomonadota bacterium]
MRPLLQRLLWQRALPLPLADIFARMMLRWFLSLFFSLFRPVRHWRGWRTPAIQALIIQLIAGILIWVVAGWILQLMDTPLYLGYAALFQGLLAALLTYWRRLARWWVGIQLVFPFALLVTVAMQFPPWLFLAAFLFMVVLYWSTFRTQVPFYPSAPAVWKAILPLLPADRPVQMVDIGSGLGGLVLALARSRPDSKFLGIELAPLPWLVSRLRAAFSGGRARFLIGDYESLDLAQFDVVFAYLSPAAMPALWQKSQREMRPGTLLLSYEFSIPGQVPHITVLPVPHGPQLYGWQC